MSMNNSENGDYYCLITCSCGRKFAPEDLYVCYVCNKLKCKYCSCNTYEMSQCKGDCRNNCIIENQARARKTCCNVCMECPLCFTPLKKKLFNNNYILYCLSCSFDSKNVHLSGSTEAELDKYITVSKEEYCKGYLKKMYNFIKDKLNNDKIVSERPQKGILTKDYTKETNNSFKDIIQKAHEGSEWDLDKLEESLIQELDSKKKRFHKKQDYIDEYYSNINEYMVTHQLRNFVPCSYDYEKVEFENLENFHDYFTKKYQLIGITNLEQRHHNVIFQNQFLSLVYPKFVDLVPVESSKSSKKCLECGALIITCSDFTKSQSEASIQIHHTYINQFPVITIYKIDISNGVILLKFAMIVNKSNKISFMEDEDNNGKVILPTGSYQFDESVQKDEFLFESKYDIAQKDNWMIFNFKFQEEYKPNLLAGSSHVLKFIVKAEFKREIVNNMNEIDYPVEVKFKV